jgi:hypothetical protein
MSDLMAMLLLAETEIAIPAERVVASLGQARASVFGAAARRAGDPLVIQLDGRLYAVLIVDRPVPDGAIEAAAGQAYWWPEAPAAASRQAAHIIVAPFAASADAPTPERVVIARALTEISAVLAAMLPASLALYWSASAMLQPVAALPAFAGDAWPFSLWLDLRLVSGSDAATGIAVRGLEAFVGRDLVMEPTAAVAPEPAPENKGKDLRTRWPSAAARTRMRARCRCMPPGRLELSASRAR